MHASPQRRVLVIGADGLRPDFVTPDRMPTVCRLAREGVHFRHHHAVYPTHTRVNISALASGAHPGRHGLVANTMIVPNATEDHIIDTGSYQHLDALDRATAGRALLVPTLGDILAERHERVAVAATSTAGASLLWTRKQRSRMINTNSAYGIADLYDLREKLGEVPSKTRGVQLEAIRYATRAVTEIFLDDPENRVVVLWFSEPDSSLHYYGLGSPEMEEAVRGVDSCVAELLAELQRRGMDDLFDVLFVSDHGHSTVVAHRTLRDYLAIAAEELGAPLPPLTTASDYIYTAPGVAEPSAEALAPLVEWLLAQPWTGAVLAGREDLAMLPGLFPLEQVWNGATNPRRPLLAVSPTWTDARNEFGVPGQVLSLTTQSALRSSHGSASPYDLHAVLIGRGPSFQAGLTSDLPTGAVDLLPTLLALLSIPTQIPFDGRVLGEGLRQRTHDPKEAVDERVYPRLSPVHGGEAFLHIHKVGATQYLHGAFRSDGPLFTLK
jgi:arylsulfatase A-like enzyme